MPSLDPSVLATVSGLGFGFSLILAIGVQTAYVLRQGLRREHVGLVVAVCAVSDLLLITAGVAGIGTLVERAPWLLTIIRYAGAVFLIGYAVLAARRAWRPGTLEADAAGSATSRRTVLTTAAAFTWLNPHVYLDTVVLLGSIASAHGEHRWWFGAGAGAASILWFTALGYGARLLSGIFARPLAWRILDAVIALTLLILGVRLLLG